MAEEKFDVIVVGAGPAGTAAALTAARAGLDVVVVERGDYPGAKNVMGGVLYADMMSSLIPEFWKNAPLERRIIEQRYFLVHGESAVSIGYRNPQYANDPPNNFTVLRAKFDKWFAEQAEAAGAFIITETVARELIRENGKVIGIRTDREDGDLYADVVIIADGVNSLLAKQAGFHPEWKPDQVALAVKEVVALPKEVIEDRFNIEPGQGVTYEFFGQVTHGMVGNAFVYTNNESLSVGLGVMLADLVKSGLHPYDLLDEFKSHPMVAALLRGGETKEYMAHLIPEGGVDAMPPLYGNGFMICGDAAQMVNALTREGSNMAMESGRIAGEVAKLAKDRHDFSVNTLSEYQRRLEKSFVLQDLHQFRHTTKYLERNQHFLSLYPELADMALHEFFLVDGASKREKIRRIMDRVKEKRSLWRIGRDFYGLYKTMK